MSETERPTLRITSPVDLLGAVPYLLGFHPAESLVIVGLDGTNVVVTARVDLADIADSDVVAETLEAIRRGGASTVVLVVFTDDPAPSRKVARGTGDQTRGAGLALLDTLLVSGGRWWSLECKDPQCCPSEGRMMPTEPTMLDAAATYAGLTALPDRDALADMFAPAPERADLSAYLLHYQKDQLDAALHGRQVSYVRSVIRALFAAHRAAQAGQLPTDEQAARFAVALQSYSVRDAVWLAVDDGRLRGIELWVNLARRLPDPYRPAPLFLAAWRAWRDGNGALAGIAADLALTSDPGYSAAELLLAALARGIDPATLPKLRMPAAAKAGDEPA